VTDKRKDRDEDARPERELEDMERRSEKLEQEIEETRGDWEAKKSDESVPGAQPDDEPDD
jgi:hypothetical protein